jgi:putative permease
MVNFARKWYEKYFVDDEAIILVLLLAAAFVVIFFLGGVLAPFFTALIFAYMLQGLVGGLQKRGARPLVAVLLSYGFFLGLMVSIFVFVLPLVWQQGINLLYEIPGMVRELQNALMALPERFPNLITPEQINAWAADASRELGTVAQKLLTASFAKIPTLVGLIIYIVLVPILVFFMLKDRQLLLGHLSRFLPAKRSFLVAIWQETDRQMGNYIRGKGVEIVIVALVSYITFALLGLNYAALLAIVTGFSVLIPYIGAAVVTLPVAAVAYWQFGLEPPFFYVLLAYAIIQALDGNVLVPIIFSEAVSLHPVSIILAVLVFGGLWGFWGLFFAIPLATLIKAIVTAWPVGMEQVSSQEQEIGGIA